MKKNIYFFNINFQLNQVFLPYVYGCLRAYCETIPELALNYQWQAPFIEMDEPERFLDQMQEPVIVGFSCYMWNWKKNIFLSQEVKKRFPDALIVFGGPEVPDRSENFFKEHPWVDLLVHSEGEVAFSKILREKLCSNPNFDDIGGLSINDNSLARKTGPTCRIERNLDIPSPYLLGYFDELVRDAHQNNIPITAFWETNRGCPFSCAFCDWGNGLTRSRFSNFSDERIFAEIEWFTQNKVTNLHNCDSNFGVFPRDLEIAKKVTESKNQNGFPKVFAATYAKNSNQRVFEISRLIHEAKMSYGTTLSVQTMSEIALKKISRENIGTEKYFDLKKKYDEAKIPTYTEMILGLPGETFESWKLGFAKLMDASMHDGIMVHPCGLFPNAPMADPVYMKENGIKTIRRPLWSTYKWETGDLAESVEIVVGTNTMTPSDWTEMLTYGWIVSVFHGGGGLRHISFYLNKIRAIPYLTFYSEFYDYFKRRPETIAGESIHYSIGVYSDLLTNKKLNYYGYSNFPLNYKGEVVEVPGGPYNHIWLNAAIHPERFYQELIPFIEHLGQKVDFELSDLIRFQKELLLSPDYCPQQGKRARFFFDWPHFFNREQELLPCHLEITYSDRWMGMTYDKELVKGDLNAFRWASQAPNGARPRHYTHQEENMLVRVKPRQAKKKRLARFFDRALPSFSNKSPFIY